MAPVGTFLKTSSDIPVMLDGHVVGHVPEGEILENFEKAVRKLKVETPEYAHLEFVVVTAASGMFSVFVPSSSLLRPFLHFLLSLPPLPSGLSPLFLPRPSSSFIASFHFF
jgi:hypothetical protein